MPRIILLCSCAALLAACAAQSPSQTSLSQAGLACVDVGIDPGSAVFGQCVFDLNQSLWNERIESKG
jgi:hypothetical protein